MKNTLARVVLAIALAPAGAFAVDGVVLVNQTTVMSAGGFPYKITQPGSYKLSGNLTVTAVDTDAIDIDSDNVTLDLNGFTISGPGQSSGTHSAKGINSANESITLRSGFVSNFPIGIFLTGTGALSDLHATLNGSGIEAITCTASTGEPCGGLGQVLAAFNGFVIVRCVASQNSIQGFFLSNATVSESIADNNPNGFIIGSTDLIHNVISNNAFGVIGSPKVGDGNLVGDNMLFGNVLDLLLDGLSNSLGDNLCFVGGAHPC